MTKRGYPIVLYGHATPLRGAPGDLDPTAVRLAALVGNLHVKLPDAVGVTSPRRGNNWVLPARSRQGPVCALLRGMWRKGGMISVDMVDGELKVVASNGRPPEERAAA